MEHSRFITLLIKKEQEHLSQPEQDELLRLMQNEQDAAAISTAVSDIFESRINFNKEISDELVLRSVEKLQHRITPAQAFNGKVSWLRSTFVRATAVAASLMIIAGLAWYFVYQNTPLVIEKNIVVTQKGSKSNITLPDGSKVWINADTRLTYDDDFGEKAREVKLEGEAYFDVTKDESRPFIVRTKTLDIRVLGTKFNVRAYKTETNTQATLISGIVEVALKKKNNEKITLKPYEKIIVQNDGSLNQKLNGGKATTPEIVLTPVKSPLSDSEALETQWVKNKLVFDQEKLEDIIPVIERWYNVTIIIKKNQISGTTFSGSFENDSLDDVLQSLKLSAGINYRIEKDKVVIF